MEVYTIMIILAQILCSYEKIVKLKEELSKLFNDKCMILAINRYKMPWESHIMAFINALNAFKTNTNIARRFDVEYLVRLFNERQINKIMDKIAKHLLNHSTMILIYCNDTISTELIYQNILENNCTITEAFNNIDIGIDLYNIRISSTKKKKYVLIGISGCSNML